MKIDLVSPHSPVALAQRLKAAVGDTLTPVTPRCVTGNGTEDHMILWVHRPHFRNDMKTTLAATMKPFEGGTRIRGRLGPPFTSSLFFGCWFTFLSMFLLFGGVMFAISRKDGQWPFELIGIVVPVFMMLVGAFILRIARRHDREDRKELLDFLSRTVAARARSRRDI